MSDDQPAAADYSQLDDSALIAMRGQIREQLEGGPPGMAALLRAHHLLTTEVARRTAALREQAR
jgi:hypothetical protein